ncbi:MAG TPA: class I SAM-dependent methyltransferase [Solirubrobacteraceae bacterium]|nr:class I SAM-dependent methyltransferase [Solirubrobacteraceae bacterium]
MPDLDAIRATWDRPEGWTAGGDEWSGPWGGTDALWHGTLLPRIERFVPARTILEIGPGQGRWSRYFAPLCEELVLVDVAAYALEACRRRLDGAGHVRYEVGDGRSLGIVRDGSVDLAFSFDSLVHAEADVLEAYADELAAKLAPDGVAFLHHSNMGFYRRGARVARALPERVRRELTRAGVLPSVYAWRAETTTAAWFARACESAGLVCIGQELLRWEHGAFLTDAITLLTPRGSRWERPRVVVRNRRFTDAARSWAVAAPLYAASPRSAASAGPS